MSIPIHEFYPTLAQRSLDYAYARSVGNLEEMLAAELEILGTGHTHNVSLAQRLFVLAAAEELQALFTDHGVFSGER